MSNAPLTRADVTLGKRKKIWVPFLLSIHMQTITVDGTQYDMYCSKSALDGESTKVSARDGLVDLDVRDPEAGITALLNLLNAQRAEQD